MVTSGSPDEEQLEIIRDYLGPAGDEENPRCPECGEVLDFCARYPSGLLRLEVGCPDCRWSFTWEQEREERPWKPLHLNYFLERHQEGESPRCPFDDCYVITSEYSDGMLEFRCPYCNRRGRKEAPSDLVQLD